MKVQYNVTVCMEVCNLELKLGDWLYTALACNLPHACGNDKYSTHHIIDKFLNGIVVIDINLVKVNGEVYVPPHIVIVFHVAVKSTRTTLKLVASQTADETKTLLILLSAKLQGEANSKLVVIPAHRQRHSYARTHPFIPEL
jgi:hypothetical protein